MPPVVVSTGRFASSLETGEAKLWVLMIGVNYYEDETLPLLRYASLDCQGVGEALIEATHTFPKKEFLNHHDFTETLPTLTAVKASLKHIIAAAQPKDTVLIYFSGHGVLEPQSHQTILCLRDTRKNNLLETGLHLQEMLVELSRCPAHNQLIWLDACHSGNVGLSGARGPEAEKPILNATHQLLEVLRQRAAKSRGFYALLSCDEGQQSWEFPDLGHGVFSYYLMRGLRGEAADSQGVIDSDGLYRYVYRHTLQYIEQTNQQLRLVNQQKRTKGEAALYPEYSQQTPKRVVEGVGEIILGLKPTSAMAWQERYGLLVTGEVQGSDPSLCESLSEVLSQEGQFSLRHLLHSDQTVDWREMRDVIPAFLQQENDAQLVTNGSVIQTVATRLLYFRGEVEIGYDGEAWLCLGQGFKLSRAWLRQELRRARAAQQIVLLDLPGAASPEDWVEELKIASEHGQCILACASPEDDPDLFAQVLLNTLISSKPEVGLAIASLLAKLQTNLDGLGINCQVWLSGAQGLIEILPSAAVIESPPQVTSQPSELTVEDLPSVEEIAADNLNADQPASSLSYENTATYENLENLLFTLVGPITPLLLAQVSAQTRMDQARQVVQELALLLPLQHQRDFVEQTEAWFRPDRREALAPSEAKTSIADVPMALPSSRRLPDTPITRADESVPQPIQDFRALRLSSDLYATIERILCSQIGPIAATLLGQLPPSVKTIHELLNALSLHLSPEQMVQITTLFQEQLQPAPGSTAAALDRRTGPAQEGPRHPSIDSGVQGAKSATTYPAVDDNFIQTCEHELVLLIGPIGRLIINNQWNASNPCATNDFVESVAAEIPDVQKAQEFRRRLL
jgi:uncharacterized caspase-like protein